MVTIELTTGWAIAISAIFSITVTAAFFFFYKCFVLENVISNLKDRISRQNRIIELQKINIETREDNV